MRLKMGLAAIVGVAAILAMTPAGHLDVNEAGEWYCVNVTDHEWAGHNDSYGFGWPVTVPDGKHEAYGVDSCTESHTSAHT